MRRKLNSGLNFRFILSAMVLTPVLLAAGCAPRIQDQAPRTVTPSWTETGIRQDDGVILPMRLFLPEGPPRAVIVALHGFNDYSRAFARPAPALTKQGIAVVAYDQRGFGGTPQRGIWPGTDRLIADMRTVLMLTRQQFPGVPLYLLGESMGGAVIMAGSPWIGSGSGTPAPDGIILVAPAVYGRDHIGLFGSAMLWSAAHTVPWMSVTGEGLEVHPTDNRDVLRELWLDPMVLKETRIDAVYGLVELMDRALAAASHLRGRVLVQYGKREDIVDPDAVRDVQRRLESRTDCTSCPQVALYPKGYHMLLRDLNAEIPLSDIVHFILDPAAPLMAEPVTGFAKP